MKALMTGNEAVARGCGRLVRSLHLLIREHPARKYWKIWLNLIKKTFTQNGLLMKKLQWKVLLGASLAGVRSFVAMKCVGVNASADPWMCFSYTGCEAGMVVAVADEPGQQSSGQSAQDDRTFFKHARYPFF